MDVNQAEDTTLHGAEKKEAYHRACEAMVKPFTFTRPANIPDGRRGVVRLAGNDDCNVLVQVFGRGGENNLHYHPNSTSVFYVLKGSVTFHGPDDVVIQRCDLNQGVFMPAGSRYWFESSNPNEEAWLLHIANYPKGKKMSKRVEATGLERTDLGSIRYDGDTGEVVPMPTTKD